MGPASQTRLVSCSDKPSDNRKGVPYLQVLMSEINAAGKGELYPPQFDSPRNLSSRHRDAEVEQLQCCKPSAANFAIFFRNTIQISGPCWALSISSR